MVEVATFPTEQVVSQAAERIAERLQEVIAENGHAGFAVPGGSAVAPLRGIRGILGTSWRSVRLTWVDERCVDFWSPDSNRGEAFRAQALDASQPPKVEVPLWLDNDTSAKALARVQAGLQKHFPDGLDVALLGMGPDGHIASLFPDHILMREPSEPWVQSLIDSPKPPEQRMTLSLAFLKKTRHSYLVALGDSKRAALLRVVQQDLALPASHLSNLTIFTDLDLGATP